MWVCVCVHAKSNLSECVVWIFCLLRSVVNARKLRLTSVVYARLTWLMWCRAKPRHTPLPSLPRFPVCPILLCLCSNVQLLPFSPDVSQSSRIRIRSSAGTHDSCHVQGRMLERCLLNRSTAQQMQLLRWHVCAMPARVMECVYPCHLLVFGVDKRAQLTSQSWAQCSVAGRGTVCTAQQMHLSPPSRTRLLAAGGTRARLQWMPFE